jgi:NTE family protein
VTDAGVTTTALEEVPLFQGLSPDGIAALHDRLRIESFPPGADLLEAAQPTPGLYVIRTGTAAAIVTDAAGAEREVATLGRGECLGEMSLISGEPCSATVRAITEIEAWFIETSQFVDLVEHQPELWRNLGRILSHRLVRTSRYVGASTESNLIALATDLPPTTEAAVALAVAESLERQAGKRTLVVDAHQQEHTTVVGSALMRLPGFGAVIADRTLLSAHEKASNNTAAGTKVCSVTDDEHPSISEGDALAALDWLRPLYDCVIVTGWHERENLSTLWHERSRAITAVVGEPSTTIPPWLDALLRLPDTARKLEIAVLTADGDASRLVQEIEDLRDKAVVRLNITSAALDAISFGPDAIDKTPGLREAIDRLARLIGELEVGIALGAGAAKGFAHVGVLKVLQETNVPIDYIVGCSIGAVVGSQLAYGVPLDEIARSMRGVDKKVMRWTIPLRSVWSNRGLKELLSGPGGRVRFRDLNTPFAAVATDVATGREVVLRKGIVWRAVMASTSVPGIFPPVVRGRHQMVDGGLVNPVPSQVVRDMGADIVVAVDLMGPASRAAERDDRNGNRARVPNLVEMLWRANEIMQEEVTMRSASAADVTIAPKMGRVRWSDFSRKGREFILAGEEAAREKLPELMEILPRGTMQTAHVAA